MGEFGGAVDRTIEPVFAKGAVQKSAVTYIALNGDKMLLNAVGVHQQVQVDHPKTLGK